MIVLVLFAGGLIVGLLGLKTCDPSFIASGLVLNIIGWAVFIPELMK